MRKRTFHPEIVPLNGTQVQELVEQIKVGKVITVDNVRVKGSEPGQLTVRQCNKCELPRPCRDARTNPNMCSVCLALDFSYGYRDSWKRRVLILADRQSV